MADLMVSCRTPLPGEDVIVRACQFFTNDRWRVQSQSARMATMVGRPKLPIGLLFLMVLGFLFFVVPGVVIYFMVIRRVIRFQNIVVTVTPIPEGTEVVVTHPKSTRKMVNQFVDSLPVLTAAVATVA